MTESRPAWLLPRLSRRLMLAGCAPLGGVVVAERFTAPARLAALRLPTGALRGRGLAAGETFRLFLFGPGGWRRTTLHEASALRREALELGFAPFDNAEGAGFRLLVTRQRGGEVRPGLLQGLLLRLDLGFQPPIRLDCNMPGVAAGEGAQMRLADPAPG